MFRRKNNSLAIFDPIATNSTVRLFDTGRDDPTRKVLKRTIQKQVPGLTKSNAPAGDARPCESSNGKALLRAAALLEMPQPKLPDLLTGWFRVFPSVA